MTTLKTEQINRNLVLLGFLYQFLGSCFLDKETKEANTAIALMDLIVHQLNEFNDSYDEKLYDKISKEIEDYIKKSTPQYPCLDCGKLRSVLQGGKVFTLCETCWDKKHK